MPLIWKLVAMGLAGIYDLVFGVFVTVLFGAIFNVSLQLEHYFLGALLGASPDIDLLIPLLTGTKEKGANKHHEYWTHRPIVGIPSGIFLGWFLGGEFWAWVAGTAIFFHYLHDTDGWLGLNDNGIAWFWPLSKKYWGFSAWRIRGRTLAQLEAESGGFESIYIKYLKPTKRSIVELAAVVVFILLIAYLGFGEFEELVGAIIISLMLVGIILIGLIWNLKIPNKS